jgi:glycosyltransferase involved in cell wall biosynthesis
VKIVYDATPLLMRSAGVKNYHYELLRRLLPSIAPHTIALFPFLDSLAANRNEESNYPPWETRLRLGAVLASNYLGLPLAEWAAKDAKIFHATQSIQRVPGNCLVTSMVHDPTPLTLPECHTATNIRYFEQFVEHTLPRLSGVIVPSAAVKRDLAARTGFPEDRMMVVHHGLDPEFFEATSAACSRVREDHELPPEFILFVGSMEPRKNLARLVEAFSGLPDELQRRFPLLIAGPAGWKNSAIQRAIESNPHVRTIGYVRRGLLPALYHLATLFVFPSLYEGFGMPLLEAMAGRTPVITSNVSAMPEVAGDAAVLVDPHSVEELRDAMGRLLTDVELAAELADAGYKRAQDFEWERTAAATKVFFEMVAGRRQA